MKDLNDHDRMLEQATGLISGWVLFCLHQVSVAAGSKWDLDFPDTIDIIVTAQNADNIYGYCKEVRSGYSVGLSRAAMKKVKEARAKAHKYLAEEANNPDTPIDRKIYLVKLTSK